MNETRPHTTIGLKKATKSRLDHNRAPGQCYDGFLCQLIELWEKNQPRKRRSAGPAGGNQGAGVYSLPPNGLNDNLPLPCGEPWL